MDTRRSFNVLASGQNPPLGSVAQVRDSLPVYLFQGLIRMNHASKA
jgi:hypothetical protein